MWKNAAIPVAAICLACTGGVNKLHSFSTGGRRSNYIPQQFFHISTKVRGKDRAACGGWITRTGC